MILVEIKTCADCNTYVLEGISRERTLLRSIYDRRRA